MWTLTAGAASAHHNKMIRERARTSTWRGGTRFSLFHTTGFKPWSKNCRMTWPPIQLTQALGPGRDDSHPGLLTHPFPRSWPACRIALMTAHCPSHGGMWSVSPCNSCPLSPPDLRTDRQPQNCVLCNLPCRKSKHSNIHRSWCS